MRYIISFIALLFCTGLFAQEQNEEKTRSEHFGLKVALGIGGFQNNLEELGGELPGGATSLGVGWGFNDRSTVWISALGGTYDDSTNASEDGGFGGLEVGYQFRFRPKEMVQPYAEIALGAYAIGRDALTFSGGGLSLGVGVDFDIWKHLAIGLEFQVKGQSYTDQRLKVAGVKSEIELDPPLEGESSALMVTFILR